MKIRFTKGDSKPDVLTCFRADGTATWVKLHEGFVGHDFLHYAVETTLDFRESFYSLVAGGMDIEDFNVRAAGQTLNLPAEALLTEVMISMIWGRDPSDMKAASVNRDIATYYETRGNDPPEPVSETQLKRIMEVFRQLEATWDQLPAGKWFKVEFPATG